MPSSWLASSVHYGRQHYCLLVFVHGLHVSHTSLYYNVLDWSCAYLDQRYPDILAFLLPSSSVSYILDSCPSVRPSLFLPACKEIAFLHSPWSSDALIRWGKLVSRERSPLYDCKLPILVDLYSLQHFKALPPADLHQLSLLCRRTHCLCIWHSNCLLAK